MVNTLQGQTVPSLVFLCADHLEMASDLLIAQPDEGPVLDLAGDLSLVLPSDFPRIVKPFAIEAHSRMLWSELKQPLTPWLLMLGFEDVDPKPPWLLPGLRDLQALLWLAEQLDHKINSSGDGVVTVVLPPATQALAMLQLARQGPELLDSLWDPLLTWWTETRRKLSHFDRMLRLQLPAADALRPPEVWRRRLQTLSTCLNNPAHSELVLALIGDAARWPVLRRRCALMPLNSLPLSRIVLQGQGWTMIPLSDSGLPILITARDGLDQRDAIRQWWGSASTPPPSVHWGRGDQQGRLTLTCRVFAPGVEKADLRITCRDQKLEISALEQRLHIPLPEECHGFTPLSARVKGVCIEIEFR
ncbi:hypothetical protein SynPROS71_02016 [Synechococcus sp. PROS-7-1]|nr:hypothetical protein SynPROS71_02016 [Synechococcus sp. PROS-7-1]